MNLFHGMMVGAAALIVAVGPLASAGGHWEQKSYSTATGAHVSLKGPLHATVVAGPGDVGSKYVSTSAEVSFDAWSTAPQAVEVRERKSRPIAFVACQDLDRSGVCEADEPAQRGCGEALLDPRAFVAKAPLIVQVLAFDNECPSPTTSGIVTVYYH